MTAVNMPRAPVRRCHNFAMSLDDGQNTADAKVVDRSYALEADAWEDLYPSGCDSPARDETYTGGRETARLYLLWANALQPTFKPAREGILRLDRLAARAVVCHCPEFATLPSLIDTTYFDTGLQDLLIQTKGEVLAEECFKPIVF